MLLLPPNSTSNGSSRGSSSSGENTAAAVDDALGLVDRVWGLATAALGPDIVRAAYEGAISARAWQAPPGAAVAHVLSASAASRQHAVMR
mgnify:CR=1 FL=1